MRKLICAVLLGIFSTSALFGDWAMVPLNELVAEADLIVVGTLYSAEEDGEGVGKGYIRVEEIVAGNAKTLGERPLRVGDSLKIKWADDWACAAGMHMRRRGEKGVWLLDVETGSVSAAYPGKFDSIEKLDEIRRLLRKADPKRKIAVDIASEKTESVVPPTEAPEFLVVDASSFPDYSISRAAIVILLATGLYLLLYRSRIRIR